MDFFKTYKQYFFVLISVLVYFFLGYFFERNQFGILFFSYSLLFLCFYFLYKSNTVSTKQLFKIGLFFRVIFLFSTPFLSQDFYRFIWDGRLLINGFSPYEFTPDTIVKLNFIPQSKILFDGMGSLSAQHFSNYPPINQLFFAFAAMFSSKSILGSIFILRLQIILADIGIYFIGRKILKGMHLNENTIFLYFLNPLIIVELTGNLHFEGVMICFLLFGIYFLKQQKLVLSAVFIAFSISTKLLPLVLLPVLIQILGWKKSIPFYVSIIVINVLLFLPFLNDTLIANYSKTISLWFINFEFNASFYYLIREIGIYFKGYNCIQTIGKFTPFFMLAVIIFFAFFKNNTSTSKLFLSSLFVLTIYLFQSTTVHPWYVINVVALCVFTKYRFPIYWSFSVILSYFAYSNVNFEENLYLVFIEYLLVFLVLIHELNWLKVPNLKFSKK